MKVGGIAKWSASPESFRGGLRASILAGAGLNRQSGQPSGSRLDGGERQKQGQGQGYQLLYRFHALFTNFEDGLAADLAAPFSCSP